MFIKPTSYIPIRFKLLLICCLFFLTIMPIFGQEDTLVFNETSAYFPGGDSAFQAYMARIDLQLPSKLSASLANKRGAIRFVVEKDGSLSNWEITQSIHPLVDSTYLTVLKGMPTWVPAQQNGKLVRQRYLIPYRFLVSMAEEAIDEPLPSYEEAKEKGLTFFAYTGPIYSLGDLGRYAKPFSWNVGLGVGYQYYKWSYGMFYDVFAGSEVAEPFEFGGTTSRVGEDRFEKINFYFPITYRLGTSKTAYFEPFLAPSIHMLSVVPKAVSKDYPVVDLSTFSLTTGLRFKKLINRKSTPRHTIFYENGAYTSGYLTIQALFSPILLRKAQTVSMNGGLVGLSLGYSFWAQRF